MIHFEIQFGERTYHFWRRGEYDKDGEEWTALAYVERLQHPFAASTEGSSG